MIFTHCEWCDDAETVLRPLIEPEIAQEFKDNIDAGRAQLWRVEGDNFVTWLVTRVDTFKCGHVELVLEVIAGTHAKAIVQDLKQKVKGLGVNSLRFETHHSEKAAARLMRGTGFERVATVFRVAL